MLNRQLTLNLNVNLEYYIQNFKLIWYFPQNHSISIMTLSCKRVLKKLNTEKRHLVFYLHCLYHKCLTLQPFSKDIYCMVLLLNWIEVGTGTYFSTGFSNLYPVKSSIKFSARQCRMKAEQVNFDICCIRGREMGKNKIVLFINLFWSQLTL